MSQDEELNPTLRPRSPSQNTYAKPAITSSVSDKCSSIRTPTRPTSRSNAQHDASLLSSSLDNVIRRVSCAPADELRDILPLLVNEVRRARTAAAHREIQYNMLCIESTEARNRMGVELAMAQREVEVLQQAQQCRRGEFPSKQHMPRHRPTSTTNPLLVDEMSQRIRELQSDNTNLNDMLKYLKCAVKRTEGEIAGLVQENECLRGRIRTNRDHLNCLLDEVCEADSTLHYDTISRNRHRGRPERNPDDRREKVFEALLLADKMLSGKTTTITPITTSRVVPANARLSRGGRVQSFSWIPPNHYSRPRPQNQPGTTAALQTPPNYDQVVIQTPRSAPATTVSRPHPHDSTDSTIMATTTGGVTDKSDNVTKVDDPGTSWLGSKMLRHGPEDHINTALSPTVRAGSHAEKDIEFQARLHDQMRKKGTDGPDAREKRVRQIDGDGRSSGSPKRSRVTKPSVVDLRIGRLKRNYSSDEQYSTAS